MKEGRKEGRKERRKEGRKEGRNEGRGKDCLSRNKMGLGNPHRISWYRIE